MMDDLRDKIAQLILAHTYADVKRANTAADHIVALLRAETKPPSRKAYCDDPKCQTRYVRHGHAQTHV